MQFVRLLDLTVQRIMDVKEGNRKGLLLDQYFEEWGC